MKDNKGRGSGLAIVIILIVGLLIAVISMTRINGLGFGKKVTQQEQTQNPVQQAQDIVDQINQRQQGPWEEP